MTVMTSPIPPPPRRRTNLDRRLDDLRARCCTGKARLGRDAAHAIVVDSRSPDRDPNIGPLEAYRCPFADEHPDSIWHVGHAMSFYRLVETARLLRARSGNEPGPVDPETGARIGRAVRPVRKRRKGHRS